MGQIVISMKGSFGEDTNGETALRGGHAAALGRAIAYLTAKLPNAIALDHELHESGEVPPEAPFGRHDKQ